MSTPSGLRGINAKLDEIDAKLNKILTAQAVNEEKFLNIRDGFAEKDGEIEKVNKKIDEMGTMIWGTIAGLVLTLIGFVLSLVKE